MGVFPKLRDRNIKTSEALTRNLKSSEGMRKLLKNWYILLFNYLMDFSEKTELDFIINKLN